MTKEFCKGTVTIMMGFCTTFLGKYKLDNFTDQILKYKNLF